jgi:hypothetical protein
MRIYLFTAAALLSSVAGAQTPRYLCNGTDADGNVRNDGCGPCNANTASRWDAQQVTFSFDDNVRPPEETLNEWRADYRASFGAWNDVQGSALQIFEGPAAQRREFGVINGENSIFWIVDEDDFIDQVGSGIDGILGVTLALDDNFCDDGTGRRSGFIDADIAMNGTGFVANWDVTSVRSTLTHEMGHAIGIGHPCIDCSDVSIMSAISGIVESDVPLFPDQQAITSLYPGEPGQLGTACGNDGDCTSGPCIAVEVGGDPVRFCSQTCGACPSGFICAPVPGEGDVCVFNNAGVGQPGEACNPPGCADGCGTVNTTCTNDAGCGAGEICEVVGTNQQGQQVRACIGVGCNECYQIDDNGNNQCFTQCDTASPDCPAGLECQQLQGRLGVCSTGPATCDEDTLLGCPPDQNCFGLQGGGAACFPAGNGGPGTDCGDDVTVCRANHLCAGVPGGGGECFRRCDNGGSCPAGETCTPLDANLSICIAGAGPGEGEGEGPNEGEGDGGGGGGDECDEDRGNFDCPSNESCDNGACENGEGPNRTFTLCDRDSDCSGGLCQNGVCTRPCDVSDGCPDNYRCDDEDDSGVPGGLCVADSCAEDASLCDQAAGFTCQYSSAERNVCALGGKTGLGLCGCHAAATERGWPVGAAVQSVAMVIGARRRRALVAPAHG